jgi:fusaric acid resistance family protein/carboxypeptidase family protein
VTAHTLRHSDSKHYPDSTPSPAPSRTLPRWLDWIDGTDPGRMRLRMATEIVVTIGVVLLAEWLFIRATGALQVPIPPKTPAAIASQLWTLNHALLVIGMMLGAILAMISGFGVSMYAEARAQVITLLILPFPLLGTLAMGLALHVRLASLASLAVVLAIGTYCRRFGPRGFNGGVLAFMGAFLGFFIQDYVNLAEYGWLAAEIGLAVITVFAVHFTLFYPRPVAAVRAMQRSYTARVRDVASEMTDVFQATVGAGENRHAEQRLQGDLLRLNEAALLIDARLDNPAALPAGWSAATLHQLLFDSEVGLSNVARFALALAKRGLPAQVNTTIGRALNGIRAGNFAAIADSAAVIRELLEADDPRHPALTTIDRVLLHRFATSVMEACTALRAFRLYPAGQAPDDAPALNTGPGEVFKTQVSTFGGWLPGSAFVAGTASQERGGKGLIERIRLAPYARIAIQMGIAAGGAIALGDQLSGRRFYWALLAAFITFMGANTAGEQLRKSAFRIAGTLIGVIVGSLLAHLVGDRVDWQIAVVLVSLFLGLYLFRVNYTFMTIGITVMVSQLYVELNEFSNSLLLLRLEETALGAGVAMLTVLLVLPLGVGRVVRVAAREQLEALADLADRCMDRLADPRSRAGSDLELRAAARRVDMTYQSLIAVTRPMRTPLFGRLASRAAGFTANAVAARHHASNLLLDASTRYDDLSPRAVDELTAARRQLAASVAAITAALHADGSGNGGEGDGQYVRSASLFAHIADGLPDQTLTSRPQLALRELELLDGALANAARWAGVPVTDLDTLAMAGSQRGAVPQAAAGARAIPFPDGSLPAPVAVANGAGPGGPAVFGYVRHGGGAPLPGATVMLIDPAGRQAGIGHSGMDGRYQVPVSGRGTYTVIAMADAYEPYASAVRVNGRPAELDVHLTGTSRLTGLVRAASSGRPLPGVTATLASARGEVVGTAVTDKGGEYAIENLVAGQYTLTLSASSYQLAASPVSIADGQQARLDAELRSGARLEGTVRNTAGAPVPDARVTLLDADGNVAGVATSSPDSGYSFENLPEGEYTVIATGYPPAASRLKVVGSDRHSHDVELGHSES